MVLGANGPDMDGGSVPQNDIGFAVDRVGHDHRGILNPAPGSDRLTCGGYGWVFGFVGTPGPLRGLRVPTKLEPRGRAIICLPVATTSDGLGRGRLENPCVRIQGLGSPFQHDGCDVEALLQVTIKSGNCRTSLGIEVRGQWDLIIVN
jgi:hypothetical protein